MPNSGAVQSQSGPAVLSPSQFITALRRGDVEAIERKHVEGYVSLRGVTVEVPVRALYTHFEGDVDFSDCTFEGGVDFSGCTFSRTLALRNCAVDGDLILDDIQVLNLPSLWGVQMSDAQALDLRGAAVRGDLVLERSSIAGAAMCGGMDVGGEVAIRGVEIDGGLVLRNSSIGANLDISVWVSGNARAEPPLNFPCNIRRGIYAQNLKVQGAVSLIGLQVWGDLAFWGSSFSSSVFLRPFSALKEVQRGDQKANEAAVLYRTHVRGDLHLAACRFDGHLEVQSATIEGAVYMQSLRGNTVLFTAEDDFAASYSGPTSVGLLAMGNAVLSGFLDLSNIQITGAKEVNGLKGLYLRNTSVSGDVRFWSAFPKYVQQGAERHQLTYPLRDGAVINGDIDASNSSISGELTLTNVAVQGNIRLKDTFVRGDIAFSSAATLLARLNRNPDLQESLEQGERPARARCFGLDLSSARCSNDVDLTGLDLVPREDSVRSAQLPASIKADSLAAEGKIQLYAKDERTGVESWSVVPGAAHFEDARAAQFTVSAHSFREKKADKNREGVNLAGADFGELKVVAIPDNQSGAWGTLNRFLHAATVGAPRELFPVPVDLRDLKVGIWSVGDDRRPRIDEFLALLNCDDTFRRDTYLRVEDLLRNAGHSEDADTLYKAMKRKERAQRWRDGSQLRAPASGDEAAREPGNRLLLPVLGIVALASNWLRLGIGQVFLYAPYRWLMGFGTAPLRLLAVIAAIWLLSLPVYFERLNYEPSLAYREAAGIDPAIAKELTPEPDNWGGATPLSVSVAQHIPVVGLGVRREWRLRTYGETCWNWDSVFGGDARPSCAGTLPIVPEDYGLLMAILNWALWPLVLTFMIRRLLRQ